MIISGLTEFLIIGSILYALIKLPSAHGHISTLYQVSLMVTLVAASLGAVKFLTSIDVSAYHQYFTFISKHTALTTFIIGAAWGAFNTPVKKAIAMGFIIAAFSSLIVNIFIELSMLSMIIMLLALVFTGICMHSNKTSLLLLMTAVIVLLSTLAWGALIKDKDTMIGVYHLCVAIFYILITSSFKRFKRASV